MAVAYERNGHLIPGCHLCYLSVREVSTLPLIILKSSYTSLSDNMSATDQMRAMLDQLMGTARDGEEGKRQKHHFTDSRVCKSFLLDCCPHDILASTVSTHLTTPLQFLIIFLHPKEDGHRRMSPRT